MEENEVEIVDEETGVITRGETAIRSLIGAGIGLAVWTVGEATIGAIKARRARRKRLNELLVTMETYVDIMNMEEKIKEQAKTCE
jgi:predicted nucleic acid-binding protein